MSARLPIQLAAFCQLLSPEASVPVILASSPIVVWMPAPKRKPTITAFDRKLEIQPILNTARTTKRTPDTKVIEATIVTACSPDAAAPRTAPAATAESAALGPVEICRDVQNSAYRIAPAAAA